MSSSVLKEGLLSSAQVRPQDLYKLCFYCGGKNMGLLVGMLSVKQS